MVGLAGASYGREGDPAPKQRLWVVRVAFLLPLATKGVDLAGLFSWRRGCSQKPSSDYAVFVRL